MTAFPTNRIGARLRRLAAAQRAKAEGFDWLAMARPNQLPPEDPWTTWLILAGRGWGKTRTGAEAVRAMVDAGQAHRIALIGRTLIEARDIMVDGPSGLLNIYPPERRPHFEPSKRRLRFHNGASAFLYSGDRPDQLRGPEHDLAWCDEFASWRHDRETWDNLSFSLRIGDRPRCIITTTPRPTPMIRALVDEKDKDLALTTGSTFDNAQNLPSSFLQQLQQRYINSRIGRQEIFAEILSELDGALWSIDLLDRTRIRSAPPLTRIVVAVDPAVSHNAHSSETGIVVAGRSKDGDAYVLADLSGRYSPAEWGSRAIAAYHRFECDRIIGEINQGGDLVERNLRIADRSVAYKSVRATRGKFARFETVAALYERGLVHHVGTFLELEDQMANWLPGTGHSPDRLDALAWALTELMLEPRLRNTQQQLW